MNIEGAIYHFHEGDLLLMNRNIHHMEIPTGNWQAVYLCLNNNFFLDFPKDFFRLFARGGQLEQFITTNLSEKALLRKDYLTFSPKTPDVNQNMNALFDEIKEQMHLHRRSMKLRVYACITEIFELLESPKSYIKHYRNLGNFPDIRKAEKIKSMIEESHGQISREEIAEKMNYSPNYVYRVFEKAMHQSIQSYCQEIQIRYFASKLESTSLSIDELCKLCNQKNKTQFYKKFREFYHMTPGEYREYLKNTAVLP